jgi:hypothetical protein
MEVQLRLSSPWPRLLDGNRPRLGGPQGQFASYAEDTSIAKTGNRTATNQPTNQPVALRYTYRAVPFV